MSDMLTLLLWIAKATALLLLAVGITISLRRAPAGARHLVWLATLVALLLVPAISAWLPLPLPVLPAESALGSRLSAVGEDRFALGSQPSAPDQTSAAQRHVPSTVSREHPPAFGGHPAESREPFSTTRIFLVVWASIGAALLGWLFLGALTVHRIVRRARVLNDESWLNPMYEVADRLDLDEAPRLVMSPSIETSAAAACCSMSWHMCAVVIWSDTRWDASCVRFTGSTRWCGRQRSICARRASAPAMISFSPAVARAPATTRLTCSIS